MNHLLLLAQCSTGIVLYPDGKTVFHHRNEKDIQYPYIIVSSLEEAEKKAQEIVNDDPNIEVGIYDTNEHYIKRIQGNYTPPPIVKKRWWKFW